MKRIFVSSGAEARAVRYASPTVVATAAKTWETMTWMAACDVGVIRGGAGQTAGIKKRRKGHSATLPPDMILMI